MSEVFREDALRAGASAVRGRGEAYVGARAALAAAHMPEHLAAGGEDEARWSEVARLVRLAIDEALLGLIATERLHPKHLRELHRPWEAISA